MPSTFYLSCALLGYLLGSLPTGYLVGRLRGIDIREHGSGNIGATNVVRVLGKKPGYFVFFCDALKGFLAVFLSCHLAVWQVALGVGVTEKVMILAGIVGALACILGHNFPVWLKFRGGKGVATTVGVLLGLMPAAVGVAAVIWGTCFYLFRYVSLASLLGAASLPVTVWVLTSRHGSLGGSNPLFWFSVAAAALIFWRHRANIGRLLNGTESRFARKSAVPRPPVA